MAKTVFILGAGASKEVGAPLMADFLDVAESIKNEKSVISIKDDIELVMKGIDAFQVAQSKAQVDLANVESVFAIFELANLIGAQGTLSPEELSLLPSAIRKTIIGTLVNTIKFTVYGGRLLPLSPYDAFVGCMRELESRKKLETNDFAVLTFNYDLCLDQALFANGLDANYCLDPSENQGRFKLLKLHGSLNWGTCPGCKKIVAWHMRDFFQKFHYTSFRDERMSVVLDMPVKMNKFIHCGTNAAAEIMIVPPTWSKMQHHQQIESVWRAAARELKEAENIVICGYSYPSSDHFFHGLYSLGTMGSARIKNIIVCNPDGMTRSRFETLLGQSARDRFRFVEIPFSECNETILKYLS